MTPSEAPNLDALLAAALAPEAEQPYPIPRNWVWVRLGAAVAVNPPKKDVSDLPAATPVAFVPMSAVDETVGEVAEVLERPLSEVQKGYTQFVDGDVLFAKITPCMENGNSAIVKTTLGGIGYGSTEFHVLRPRAMTASLAYRLARSQEFRDAAKQVMSGAVGQQRVPKAWMEEYPVPLPPPGEQLRLADKLDSLLAKVAEARSLLDEARETFAERRAAIFARAFRGQLTERDWKDEPAEKPLERIKSARLKSCKTDRERENVLSWYPVRELEKAQSSATLAVPAGWVLCRVGQLGTVCNGSTPSRKVPGYWDGAIPWVSSGEVSNNLLAETRACITDEGYRNSSVRLLPEGTILLAMIGEGKTRGQSAVLRIAATINQNIAAVVVDHGLICPEYLWYWFQYQYETTRESGGGTGPKALNCQKVRELPVILPPLAEQRRIVDVIQAAIEKEQEAGQGAQEALVAIEATTQAILARAFRGELGTNDPTEPSALDLLREVLATRGAEGKETRTRRAGGSGAPAARLAKATPGEDGLAAALLAHLKPGLQYFRADVTRALGLSTAQWNAAIGELVASGKVVRSGDKRGARYSLPGSS